MYDKSWFGEHVRISDMVSKYGTAEQEKGQVRTTKYNYQGLWDYQKYKINNT